MRQRGRAMQLAGRATTAGATATVGSHSHRVREARNCGFRGGRPPVSLTRDTCAAQKSPARQGLRGLARPCARPSAALTAFDTLPHYALFKA
eukprot:6647041-Prymnesium_polylepis.1